MFERCVWDEWEREKCKMHTLRWSKPPDFINRWLREETVSILSRIYSNHSGVITKSTTYNCLGLNIQHMFYVFYKAISQHWVYKWPLLANQRYSPLLNPSVLTAHCATIELQLKSLQRCCNLFSVSLDESIRAINVNTRNCLDWDLETGSNCARCSRSIWSRCAVVETHPVHLIAEILRNLSFTKLYFWLPF